MMKPLRTLAAVFALASASALAATPQEAWQADIKQAEAAYSTAHFAILKIDDAVYLKPGQQAWLVAASGPPGKVAWRLAEPKTSILSLAYAGENVTVTQGGAVRSLPAEPGGEFALDATHDVRVQYTQIAPNQMGVRVFAYNQDNPNAKAFTHLSYYPYNAAYIVQAAFTPETPQPVDFQTSRGWTKRFYRVGSAHFTLNGADTTLPLYADAPTPTDGLSAFFTDDTTGKATYDVGRYVDTSFTGAYPPKTVTLDFNYAYNPNCARSPHYNCPYATDVIATAVEAGELAPPPH